MSDIHDVSDDKLDQYAAVMEAKLEAAKELLKEQVQQLIDLRAASWQGQRSGPRSYPPGI